MGHYDWAYENQSVEQVEIELKRAKDLLDNSIKRKDELYRDIKLVSGYTARVVTDAINKTDNDIEYWGKAVSKWEEIVSRVRNGAKLSWEYCHSIAEPRRYY